MLSSRKMIDKHLVKAALGDSPAADKGCIQPREETFQIDCQYFLPADNYLIFATFARLAENVKQQASGKTFRLTGTLKQGLDSENAKKINKLIRDEGPKGVKTQVQGDEIRVSSKKRDDLQAVIALLKGSDLDVALQFVNYR